MPGPMPGFQGVQPGLDQALRGFSRASFGTSSAGTGAGPAQTTPTAQPQLDPDAWRPPTLTGRVGAAADTIEGLEQASAPYILPALVAGAVTSIPAAVAIGVGVVGGYAREEGVRKGLEYVGADPRMAKFAGKVAGWWPESHIPGYTSAVSGAAEALLPNSPTKQFAGGLEESIAGFNQLVDEVGKMDPASPEYSQALTSLKSGEAQLGVAASTLAQANLLGAIKSAQMMGKMRSVPESAKADSLAAAASAPVSPDIIPLDQAIGDGAPSAPAEPKYKSGTTQYNLPEDLSARVQFLGESIPDSALAESGRETDPHLTIRYGIQDDPQVAIPKIRQALAGQAPITVRLGETSLFPDRGDGEVLKIDLDQSPELEGIRDALAQSGIDHIPDKGDKLGYSPHITVAYLKPGEGQNHIGPSPLTGQEMVIDRIWVGDRNGNQYEIPFGKSMEGILGPEGEAIRGMAGGEAASQSNPKFSIVDQQMGEFESKLLTGIKKLPERISAKGALAALDNMGVKKDEQAYQHDFYAGLRQLAEYAPDHLLSREDLVLLPKANEFRERIRTGTDVRYASHSYRGPDTENGSYRERLFIQPRVKSGAQTHWPDDQGVMLHTRESDRVLPDGAKAFLLDEVQSDWAQQGRSRGYLKPGQDPKEVYAAQEAPILAKAVEWMTTHLPEDKRSLFVGALNEASRNPILTPGRYAGQRQVMLDYFMEHFSDDLDLMDVPDVDAFINRHYVDKLPLAPMPFPDSWAELAVRRTLQEAAKGDYKKFQWLGGKAQADRYSLRKVVDELGYNPQERRLVGRFNKEDVIDRTIDPDKLPDYVGKEITERLLAQPTQEFRPGESWHNLEGQELEVGGRFHQTLYDTRIPSYVKKLTRQQPRKIEIVDTKGEILEGWEIDITPEVRTKMSQPQPLFHVTQSGQPAAFSPQLWTPEQLSKSLPGYKLDLLPNNEKANPGGATLGIETPSGKWAKLVVTRGRDLSTDPAAVAAQLGRPAQPGDVVVGQYESRGLREQSVITLAGAAGPDTLDHELFH